MSNTDEKAQAAEAAAKAKKEAGTLEDLLDGVPISDEKKQVLSSLFEGLANNLAQINNRLADLETKGDSADPEMLKDLTAEQKYNILLAKASAPAAAAQQNLLQAMVTRSGSSGGSEIEQLVGSAEKINALRSIFSPEPSPVQVAMEKAQIAQTIAQSRLVNKVAGKQTSDYLDKLEKDLLSEPGAEPGSEAAEK